jgi:16S rRNA G966 N2-methylase RsmD
VARLARVAHSGTVVVWEQEVDHESQPNGDAWEILRDKTYGRARFLILRKL